MRIFPADHMASGWYQVGWSADFPRGSTVAIEYFGRDLVGFRGESGEVQMLDAHCAHLGAHLGHGGTVEGDCIRCPFHGWAYDAEGVNVDVPYGRRQAVKNARLRRWPTAEIDDLVLVFYSDDLSRTPDALPAAFNRYEQPTWPVSPETTHSWPGMAMTPLVVAENAVDAAHFKYVHGSNDFAEVRDFEAGDGMFSARIELRFGGGRETTWATPNGPVDGHIFTEQWGLGVGRAQLVGFDDITYVLGVTPVSPFEADLRSTTWVPRARPDGTPVDERMRDRWVGQQNSQVAADLQIWTHQSYVHKPPLERSEVSAMRAFRRWAQRFYDTGG